MLILLRLNPYHSSPHKLFSSCVELIYLEEIALEMVRILNIILKLHGVLFQNS